MKKLLLIMCVVFFSANAFAGQIELRPYLTVPISTDLEMSHGEGMELDFVFDNGWLGFGSVEIAPIKHFGNLNLVVLGFGYKKQWTNWNLFGKVGVVKSHDSDLYNQKTYTTTQKVYKLVKTPNKRCYKPKYEEVLITQTHYSTERREFGNGGMVEIGGGYHYPLSDAWTLGVDLSGRYIKVKCNNDYENMIHGKGIVSFNLKF